LISPGVIRISGGQPMLGPTGSLIVLAGLALPAPADVGARLDAALQSAWAARGVTPGVADDATFLRRAWLDLAGHRPPPLKARAFLDDRDPAKRERLVDELLASEEFADYWGRAWAELLTGQRPVRHERHNGRALAEYLRDSLAVN